MTARSALPPRVRQAVEGWLSRFCEERVPEHVRDRVRLTFKVRGQSVTLSRQPSLRG